MVARKQIWDTMDELEGKKKGSSYEALKKEIKRQGYGIENCDFCGKRKRIGKPCTCMLGGVFG